MFSTSARAICAAIELRPTESASLPLLLDFLFEGCQLLAWRSPPGFPGGGSPAPMRCAWRRGPCRGNLLPSFRVVPSSLRIPPWSARNRGAASFRARRRSCASSSIRSRIVTRLCRSRYMGLLLRSMTTSVSGISASRQLLQGRLRLLEFAEKNPVFRTHSLEFGLELGVHAHGQLRRGPSWSRRRRRRYSRAPVSTVRAWCGPRSPSPQRFSAVRSGDLAAAAGRH